MSDKWHRIADRMAIELAPMASCGTHRLPDEDSRNCADCSVRRAYLDYLATGGTDTRLETTAALRGARSVPIQDLAPNDHLHLPGCPCGGKSG